MNDFDSHERVFIPNQSINNSVYYPLEKFMDVYVKWFSEKSWSKPANWRNITDLPFSTEEPFVTDLNGLADIENCKRFYTQVRVEYEHVIAIINQVISINDL